MARRLSIKHRKTARDLATKRKTDKSPQKHKVARTRSRKHKARAVNPMR